MIVYENRDGKTTPKLVSAWKNPNLKRCYRVKWLSRHVLSGDQLSDLAVYMKINPLDIDLVTENVVWQATADVQSDKNENLKTWSLLKESADIIIGVFPPVAIEALPPSMSVSVLTPVSRQAPELRVGDNPIPFVHVRWVKMI